MERHGGSFGYVEDAVVRAAGDLGAGGTGALNGKAGEGAIEVKVTVGVVVLKSVSHHVGGHPGGGVGAGVSAGETTRKYDDDPAGGRVSFINGSPEGTAVIVIRTDTVARISITGVSVVGGTAYDQAQNVTVAAAGIFLGK